MIIENFFINYQKLKELIDKKEAILDNICIKKLVEIIEPLCGSSKLDCEDLVELAAQNEGFMVLLNVDF